MFRTWRIKTHYIRVTVTSRLLHLVRLLFGHNRRTAFTFKHVHSLVCILHRAENWLLVFLVVPPRYVDGTIPRAIFQSTMGVEMGNRNALSSCRPVKVWLWVWKSFSPLLPIQYCLSTNGAVLAVDYPQSPHLIQPPTHVPPPHPLPLSLPQCMLLNKLV